MGRPYIPEKQKNNCMCQHGWISETHAKHKSKLEKTCSIIPCLLGSMSKPTYAMFINIHMHSKTMQIVRE